MNNTQNNSSTWDIKYLKEYPFMPFGSLLNAWANINQGKGISLEEFLEQAEEIFKLAKKLVENRAKETQVSLDNSFDEPEF